MVGEQLSLDFNPPDPGANRIGKFNGPASGAPETQRAAAILTYPRTGIARERVLRLISQSGERGVTDEEGTAELGMLMNTYRPRRNELLNDGWIVDPGLRRRTVASGAYAVAWVLSAGARERLW